MINFNNRLLICLITILFYIFSINRSFAANESLCINNDIVLVFFNGVNTTEAQARMNLIYLKSIHGTTSPKGDKIKYEYLYNYTNGLEDFVETFEQRLKEQDDIVSQKFELFFSALSGGNGSWWNNIVGVISSYSDVLTSLRDKILAGKVGHLRNYWLNPPTISNYVNHQQRILEWTQQGKKLVFVAHSQGNLFANAAYDYALTLVSPDSVKVVHIAPASPRIVGPHVLADKDLVINALRAVGTVASITDTIPGYLVREPGPNTLTDILGHGLVEIYLNSHLTTADRVKTYINNALSTVIAPEQKVSNGFFTVTLGWDGPGDVDLHTYEPSGSHVYYAAPQGISGKLDQDNTTNGTVNPEHYYATCDANSLQTGTYRVAIANYRGATGRKAHVQAATTNGVIGDKEVTLGAETGDTPSNFIFNILVTKNEQTGVYKASIN